MDSDRTIVGPMVTPLFLIDSKGTRIEINRDIIAGREVGCDLLLEEGRCSRKHARLQPAPDGLLVTDLGSSNGTFINGNRIESGLAKSGDELCFDTAKYKVQGVAPLPPVAEVTTVVTPFAIPAVPLPVSVEMPVPEVQGEVQAGQKGAWWAPKDEGPEGTLLMQPGISVQQAALDGTQVMAALSVAEPSLVGLSGTVKGKSFKFSGDRWKIGRDAGECNVVLDDAGVSAFHAQILHESGTWKLINLMSSNGSFVNGQRVQTAYLNSGDRLQFGNTEFIFNLGGVAAASGGSIDTITVRTGGAHVWLYAVIGFLVVAVAGAAWFFLKGAS